MKKILHFVLKVLSKAVLAKYQPRIIAITGSVGKTSAKEAIFAILSEKYEVRRNVKNYNNEIGLPLTILNKVSAGNNLWAWCTLVVSSFFSLLILTNKKYPKILILEMGADRPGDIAYLTSIAKPDLAVLTAIGSSHIEFFGSKFNIAKEKGTILDRLTEKDVAILNEDDELLVPLKTKTKSLVLSFGQSETSDVQIKNIAMIKNAFSFATTFEIIYQNQTEEIILPGVLGQQHALAAAAAASVALALGFNLKHIKAGLLKYQPAKGRTNLIKGIKNSWIIDDTYNASPQSAKVAVDILKNIQTEGRKIAVLGDMLELGQDSESEHNALGEYIAKLEIDYLFVVGERSRDIQRGAIVAGMSEDKIYHFAHTIEAGYFLQDRIKEDDVILVKGSRGAKMEQVVYEIMAKPWEALEVLVGPVK